MTALHLEPEKLKVVHAHGVGLVDFAELAEELGFDGLMVTEHHAPLMTCPSPRLLLAAAAMRTSRIRLGTAVTISPLYEPVRATEEAGTLDLLSGGRFELGLVGGFPVKPSSPADVTSTPTRRGARSLKPSRFRTAP